MQRDKSRAPGGVTAEALARRLGEAVSVSANGNGNGNGNGRGPRHGSSEIELPSPRDVAIDVCRAILAETDVGTAEHSDDVVLISDAIGQRMGISGPEGEDLLAAARLHDIGKAWVPKRILEKPGALTDEEWAVMRQHTIVGEEILSSVAELADVGHVVRHSHERWDGAGYPDRLAGPEIPLGSRIIFCADAFHAIRCDRPYRAGRSAAEAVAEIKRCAGTQFDPTVASALEEVVRERRRRPRGARSSRLFALLMCLVVGGAGTALARSDLLGESSGPAPSSAPKPPPACGTAACPSVALPVGGLAPVGVPGLSRGPRALQPGLPGRLHGGVGGGKRNSAGGSDSRGKSQEAKADQTSNGKGKALGHSGKTHSAGGSSSSQKGSTSGSSSSGASKHSGNGHHSSAGNGSSGSSHGQGGGRGAGASHGNSGNSGGASPGNSGNASNGNSGNASNGNSGSASNGNSAKSSGSPGK